MISYICILVLEYFWKVFPIGTIPPHHPHAPPVLVSFTIRSIQQLHFCFLAQAANVWNCKIKCYGFHFLTEGLTFLPITLVSICPSTLLTKLRFPWVQSFWLWWTGCGIHYGEDGSHSEVHIAIERSLHFSKSNGCSKMRYFLTFKMKIDMFNLGKRVWIGFQNRRLVIVTIVYVLRKRWQTT